MEESKDREKIYNAIGDLWKKRASLVSTHKTEEIVTIAIGNVEAFKIAAYVSMTDLGYAGASGRFINQEMQRFRLNFMEVPK
jgi:hypothetical protein